jgi:hypothetical protein
VVAVLITIIASNDARTCPEEEASSCTVREGEPRVKIPRFFQCEGVFTSTRNRRRWPVFQAKKVTQSLRSCYAIGRGVLARNVVRWGLLETTEKVGRNEDADLEESTHRTAQLRN